MSDTVISSSPVTPAGQGEVAAFIAEHLKGLKGDDASGIRKAKHNLEAPLNNPALSESFRREYGSQLLGELTKLAADPREVNALNAVRLAGALGTKDGMDVTLKALDDKRVSVKMMGATSTGLAIGTGRNTKNRALSPRNVTDALDTLNGKMQAETDPRVLDAMVLALDDAMKVKVEELDGVRVKATNMLLAQASRMARDPKVAGGGAIGLDLALSHTTKALGDAMLVTGPEKLSNTQVQEAGGVAGDAVAWILRRVDAGIAESERSRLGVLAQLSESIVRRGTEALGGKASEYKLDDLLREGKDAEFRTAAIRMFRDLMGTPFDRKTPPDRYPAK